MDPTDLAARARGQRVVDRQTHIRLDNVVGELQITNSRLDALSNSLASPSSSTYIFTPTVGAPPVFVSVIHRVDTGDIVVSLLLLILLSWLLIRSIFNATRGLAL